MQIVDACNSTNFGEEEHHARYDEEQDKFCFCDGGLEEWDCFEAKVIEAEGKTIKVYPIGAFYWIWSERKVGEGVVGGAGQPEG
jgi:hypothetical protein